MTRRKVTWSAVVVITLAGMGAFAWMFRSNSTNDRAWGVVTYQWRWGRPYRFEMDRNRDGMIDLQCIVDTGERFFSPHTMPKECWIDSKYRGFFDHHVVFSNGDPVSIELLNANGRPARTLFGPPARRYYDSLPGFTVR